MTDKVKRLSKERKEALDNGDFTADRKINYYQIFHEKDLPYYWFQVYKLEYSRLRKWYGLKRKEGHPLFDLILEKVAYVKTKMLFVESPDFYKITGLKIDNPKYYSEYTKIMNNLVKVLEQIMKYTESTKKETKSETKSLTLVKEMKSIEGMSEEEIEEEIRRITNKRRGAIETSASPKGEEKEEDR